MYLLGFYLLPPQKNQKSLTNSLGWSIEKTFKVNTKSCLLFLHFQKYHVAKSKMSAHKMIKVMILEKTQEMF